MAPSLHRGKALEPTISDREIALIKGMLNMEFKPALVQAYFTRPGRLVNPARIQEIKTNSSARIAAISAASEDDVGYFIDEFARLNPALDSYAPPTQEPEVTQFRLAESGKVTIITEEANLQFGAPEVKEIYDELRAKAVNLTNYGHNSLGPIHADVVKFLDVLKEDPVDASVVRVFMRGGNLKSKFFSYQAYKENPELYPLVNFDAAVAPLIQDLIEAFSLLVNLTPAMALLESKATTKEEYATQGEALKAIKPAIDEVENVADQDAAEVLHEQVADGLNAPIDQIGRSQRGVAFSSIRNFAISIFTPVYHAARYVLGDSKLPSIIQSLRNGAAYDSGQKLYSYLHDRFPEIIGYIRNNADSLSAYAEKIVTNQQLQDFIRAIIEIMRNLP